MKQRKISRTSVLSKPDDPQHMRSSNYVMKNGSFTFPNGDRYKGEYKIGEEPTLIFRQGRGIYNTADFNDYECVWDSDKISEALHISFNNGTKYNGSVDENGKMSGRGTYYLPDRSSVTAEWNENRVVDNIQYKEPLGHIWDGRVSDVRNKVVFGTQNQFWNDMRVFDHTKRESQDSEARNS